MKNFFRKIIKNKKIRYKLLVDSKAEAIEIKSELSKIDCKVDFDIESLVDDSKRKGSLIVLAYVKDHAKVELEEYYQKAVFCKLNNIKFLVISDNQVWKKRHDNQLVFNFPSNTHSYEIARNLHYLSLVG